MPYGQLFCIFYCYFWFIMVFYLFLDTLRPCRRQQAPSNHVQVRQGKEHEYKVGVLRQALVPDLRKAEDPFRDEKEMLSPASGFREQAVRSFFFFGELFVFLFHPGFPATPNEHTG